MVRKNAFVAALVGSLAVGAVASAADRFVYAGGHSPATLVRVVTVDEQAPYALTGERQARAAQEYQTVRVGSRVVAVQPVLK